MKIRFLNKVNIIISSLLAALGFASCGHGGSEVIDKYGCPEVKYGGPYEVYEEIEQAEEQQAEESQIADEATATSKHSGN